MTPSSKAKPTFWEKWGGYIMLFLAAIAGSAVAVAASKRDDDSPSPSPKPEAPRRSSSPAQVVFTRQTGESQSAYNERATKLHQIDWEQAKREVGKWQSKADYEARTGRKGRPD